METRIYKKPNSIIIKYVGPTFSGKVRFGRFKNYKTWVEYLHHQTKEGNPLQMCMSYFDYSSKASDPCFKEVNTHPYFGSSYINLDSIDGELEG